MLFLPSLFFCYLFTVKLSTHPRTAALLDDAFPSLSLLLLTIYSGAIDPAQQFSLLLYPSLSSLLLLPELSTHTQQHSLV